MAQRLLASTYSTPGRRAYGRLGLVPAGSKDVWGSDFDPSGMVVAAVAVSVFGERARAPTFGVATTMMKGKKPVTSLYLALAFVHPEDRPDIVVVLGIHGLNHPWLRDYYGKE